jgi:hypothetical protein
MRDGGSRIWPVSNWVRAAKTLFSFFPLLGTRAPYFSDVRFTSLRVFTFSIFAFWGSLGGRKGAVGAEMEGASGCAKTRIGCETFLCWRVCGASWAWRAMGSGASGLRGCAALAGKRRILGDVLISAQVWHTGGAVQTALDGKWLVVKEILFGNARDRLWRTAQFHRSNGVGGDRCQLSKSSSRLPKTAKPMPTAWQTARSSRASRRRSPDSYLLT